MPGRWDSEKDTWLEWKIRPCSKCGDIRPWADFGKLKHGLFGLNPVCNDCRRPISKQQWKHIDPASRLLWSARTRAKQNGITFNIDITDIVIPKRCPVFGFKLRKAVNKYEGTSPSLDRINPRKGYVKGNVRVISWRANQLKNNMTANEAILLAKDSENW